MSGGIPCLELSKDDVRLMIAAAVFTGSENCNFQMSNYVHARNKSGHHIIKINRTWEKIILAARAIAAIENAADVIAVGLKTNTQRAVLKFSQYTNCSAIAGRFTPGAFTNQIQSGFKQPRLLIVSDPVADQQPIIDASCGDNSIALCWWMLAREVRRIKCVDSRSQPWDVMVDLFIHRDSNEEKELEAKSTFDEQRALQNGTAADPEADNWQPESLLTGAPGAELINTGMTTGGYARLPGTVGGEWGDYEDSRPW